MDRRAVIQQLHRQPFDIPRNIREHFEGKPVAAAFLSLETYEPTVNWSRQPGSMNGLMKSTLQSEDTIPYWITLRTKQRRTPPSEPINDPSFPLGDPDLISLIHLGGSGLCSYPNTLHGGMVSTLFDEVSLATINHCFDTHPANQDNPTRFFTMQLTVKYRHAVKLPGIVVIRSWCAAVSGRKCWTYAELLQETDDDAVQLTDANSVGENSPRNLQVKATCESFWLRSQETKL
jgi:hypothetical protein